jgi:radical SAM protein with 4Fe4S-binding SPASM domain
LKTTSHKNAGFSFMGVEIEINHDCNRACTYCPNSLIQRKHQGRMSEELFRLVMKQLQAINYKGRISYHFYNEPLLSPDLDLFVKLTREYLPETWIEIYTNGTLLDEARLMALLEHGVNKFTVTRHHSIKNFPFEELYSRLEPGIKAKIKYQQFQDLIFTSRGGMMKVGYIKEKPPLNVPCYIPSSVFVITVNGNVIPCFEDYDEQNVMGNIQEKTIAEIWHQENYTQFREDLKKSKRTNYPVCRTCNCQLVFV